MRQKGSNVVEGRLPSPGIAALLIRGSSELTALLFNTTLCPRFKYS